MTDQDWIKLEPGSLEGMLKLFQPEMYHPKDPRYREHWRLLRQRCVNGIWVEQFGQYRYMNGRLGFFNKHTKFEDWKDKQRIIIAPKVRDLEWHRAYHRMEMDGFSGFSEDEKYTSDREVFSISRNKLKESDIRKLYLFKSDGKFKEFIEPREALYGLHDSPKGLPLYKNDSMNLIEFGSRGGGKTYWDGLGEGLYDIVFDNAHLVGYFPGVAAEKSRASIEITSGGDGKSTMLIEKIRFAMNCLKDPSFPELGVWKYKTGNKVEFSPFYKTMTGDIKAGNHENPWINHFDVQVGRDWKKKGSKSAVYNTVYAKSQKHGGQKSAGGRRTKVTHEEIGINEKLLEAWGSNEGMISEGGRKYAGQKGIGTSGNVITVRAAKKIFTHPRDYSCMVFQYPEQDPEGEFGFFIPVYMVDNKFKNKDGTTDVEAAKAYHQTLHDEKALASDPKVLLDHRMHFPMKIDHMWYSGGGSYMPVKEAEDREKALMKGNLYEKIGTPVKLSLSSEARTGIKYEVDFDAEPFYEWPLASDRRSLEPVFMMYINPDTLMINGVIPNDMIIVLHDPYISEEVIEGGSLGVAHYIVNPKYIPFGKPGNCLAATLIGRSRRGTDHFNEILLKGMKFYGSPIRGLWYEGNRGDKVRGFFIKKQAASLLCLKPQFEQGSYIYQVDSKNTGYVVGGKLQKTSLLDGLRDWYLEETLLSDEEEAKLNIERFPCIFTIRQTKLYEIDKNFDAVSSMQAIKLAINEQEFRIKHVNNARNNPLRLFTNDYKKQLQRYARY